MEEPNVEQDVEPWASPNGNVDLGVGGVKHVDFEDALVDNLLHLTRFGHGMMM
jgi:hypothetical protein